MYYNYGTILTVTDPVTEKDKTIFCFAVTEDFAFFAPFEEDIQNPVTSEVTLLTKDTYVVSNNPDMYDPAQRINEIGLSKYEKVN